MFARLHNICVDELKKQNPNWKADRVFEEARLIVMSAIKQINYSEVGLPEVDKKPSGFGPNR